MKASILAIGTELTTGQILNRNASNLSQKLSALGVNVTIHLTVPDERQVILDSLKYLESQLENNFDLLFVTGGLGPTSDDFTRDVLAEWSGVEMKFDQRSWDAVVERLTTRGFKVRDMQKQQCFFPVNAEILPNAEGTANAYTFIGKNKIVYVLPGPPREIEAIWTSHIAQKLAQETKNLDRQITKSWDTIGLGESEVAFAVEDVLRHRPTGDLEIGYRVHLPYVEVKLSFLSSDSEKWAPWIRKTEDVLQKITVARDFSDAVVNCCEKIRSLDFTFYDFVSTGFLHLRLQPYLKNHSRWSWKQSNKAAAAEYFENEENFLALIPLDDGQRMLLLIDINGEKKRTIVESPYNSSLMLDRKNQYFAEMALVHLSKILKK